MVDAVVSFAVERLGDLLIQETVFLHGVRGQVDQLRTELTRMQCFLKDADAKQHLQGDERVRNWVAEIRDVAYDAEDVIDTFILNAASSSSENIRRTREGSIRGFLMRCKIIINKPIRLHKDGTEIGAILARLQGISNSRSTYGIKDVGHGGQAASSSSTSSLQQQLRRSYPHVEDEDVIGLEEYTEALVAELKKEDEGVISIFGIGGLGKTTLAKKVYNHKDVKTHFDCCVWTFISQQFSSREVLQELLRKVSSATDQEITNMTEVVLVEKLHSYLKEKRYLVVLDDIWSEEAWDVLSPAFPLKGMKMGSKVLLTTRKKDVASHADPRSLHLEPRLLTDDESWKLLCRKVFHKNLPASKYCSPELEKLGRKMVSKCGGLPLGVAILGGLLVTKELEIIEWDVVLRDINAYMNKGGRDGGVSGILSLSYNDLPCHLKPCFLYLGLFPEDYAIGTRNLIRLWMAEGFIQQKKGAGGLTMEEEGEHKYLAELIQRCMVQVDERSLSTGGVRTCRVHDLMRDLCLSKAREVNFLDIYEYDRHHHHDQNLAAAVDSNPIVGASPTTNHMIRLRRHAIHSKGSVYKMIRFDYLQNSTYSHIRTLLAVPGSSVKVAFRSVITNSYQNIKLLRVLDLGSLKVDKNATEQIGKLIHLRYLALRGDNFEMETSSAIGNLRNLQTLKLFSFGGWLPEKIARMEQLRYLNSSYMKMSEKWLVDNYLINLQTLKRVSAVGWLTKDCGFEKLTSLRTLKIHRLLRSQIEEVILPYIVARSSSSNHNYPGLTSLFLHCRREEEFPNLEPLSLCHNLLKLWLWGGYSKSKNLLLLSVFPPNLTKLTLYETSLNQDRMATLQHLPNLKFLNLYKSYSGEEMVCSAQGFPKLQFLHLHSLEQLKEWRVDQGGMPSLKRLVISHCWKLRMLPEGLKFITTLQQLEIGWVMSKEFKGRIERGSGDDWYKIQHIPSISILNF